MRRLAGFSTAIAITLSCGAVARADGPTPAPVPAVDPSPYIDWQPTLVSGFEAAKKLGKPLFIAINAEKVDGKNQIEPAAKELRENTYHDSAVVGKSREFVCVLMKPDANSADYGELRGRFSIDGVVVSPQHIFAHADGSLIDRKEYWSYAAGAESVTALLGLMDAALTAHRAKLATPAGSAAGTPDEQRAAWIRERITKVRDTSAERAIRDLAIKDLAKGDQKGDCIDPLCTAMLDLKKDTETQISILKALGRPGLEIAVASVLQLLDAKSDDVRSNAAVTLEYIGSAQAIEPLTKRLGHEKDEFTYNNCCRALGRCGTKQEKSEAVRKTLLREAGTGKSDKVAAGPAIGLAYFEKDAEAARGIEKILEKGPSWQKRTFLLYALTEIDEPKSGDFVKEKILKTEKNPYALAYLNNVIAMLSKSDEAGTARSGVEGGVGFAIGALGGVGGNARRDRDQTEWKPKGDFAPPGGGRGGPGGTPPPPGSGMGG
jgi:hypothetical protein